jgi:hypothetical protein
VRKSWDGSDLADGFALAANAKNIQWRVDGFLEEGKEGGTKKA